MKVLFEEANKVWMLGGLAIGLAVAGSRSMVEAIRQVPHEIQQQRHLDAAKESPMMVLPKSTEVVSHAATKKQMTQGQGPFIATVAYEDNTQQQHPLTELPSSLSNSASVASIIVYDKFESPPPSSQQQQLKKGNLCNVIGCGKVVSAGWMPTQVVNALDGNDFAAVEYPVEGVRARYVRYYRTAVQYDTTNAAVDNLNELCLHWIPSMASSGFSLVGLLLHPNCGGFGFKPAVDVLADCARQGGRSTNSFGSNMKTADALWRLTSSPLGSSESEPSYSFPTLLRKATTAKGNNSTTISA